MPRRRVVAKREILPDPVYGSELIAKFVNCVMRHGKKSLAEQIVYGALEELVARRKRRHKDKEREEGEGGEGGEGSSGTGRINTSLSADLVDLLDETLDKLRPGLEVRSRRVGGATYQIPVEVPAERRTTLAMRWLIDAAKDRGEKTMAMRLAAEMGEALEGRGSAIKKREDVHRMAKANQAFAHFRWN